MKKILFILTTCAISLAMEPLSENYFLKQSSFNTGGISTSENYNLSGSAVGEISGEKIVSGNFSGLPGYYLGELSGNILSPENVTIVLQSDTLMISWTPVIGAVLYKVYSSDDPYTGFIEDTLGILNGESWSIIVTEAKKFYYVTADN